MKKKLVEVSEMEKDSKDTNIFQLPKTGNNGLQEQGTTPEACETGEYIVDMLDSLMQIAAKKDQSMLVYLLAMARIEANIMITPKEKS